MKFYSATEKYNTRENPVNAPYIRGCFDYDGTSSVNLKLVVVGIYELYLNGNRITKGYFGPYRTNPTKRNYLETYDLTNLLVKGKNVISILLGNGFSCSTDTIWSFSKVNWIHSPKIALSIISNDKEILSGADLLTHPSEYEFDDFHAGEHINANLLIRNWKDIDFDDSNWNKLIPTDSTKGEISEEEYDVVKEIARHNPKKIIKGERGYIFDFGKSMAGTYVLKIKGQKDKTIRAYCRDALLEGRIAYSLNMTCCQDLPFEYFQCDWLTLSGEVDTFSPVLSYKGCRYIEFEGMSKEELDTVEIYFIETSSLTKRRGYFECDNKVINYLQNCTVQSDLSNALQYPTDCPQREKNGWTADAALSCEQFLLNFDSARFFKTYIQAVVDSQREDGAIPGIVPTDTWGFAWGAGPAWDNVLFEIPWRTYLYSGDKEILEIAAPAIKKYLKYMVSKKNADGLFAYGLEDWLPVKSHTPLEVTDSIMCKSICDTASKIFNILNDDSSKEKALELSNEIKANFLKKYPCYNYVVTTQTHGAMAIYYDLYDMERVSPKFNTSYELLKHLIKYSGDHMDFGVLGNRVMWRVLGDNNDAELAVKMMIDDRFPSFKTSVYDNKLTTLPEGILDDNLDMENLPTLFHDGNWSFNHHFWGDISAFFYKYLAGIKLVDFETVNFSPEFVSQVNKVKASFAFKNDNFTVEMRKTKNKVTAKVFVPDGVKTTLTCPKDWTSNVNELSPGLNKITFKHI